MADSGDERADLRQVAPGLAADAPRRNEILTAHSRAVDSEEDGYIDPVSGFFVMTATYHLERGSCCENQCRHCPYP